MENNSKKLVGVFMALGGAIMTINALVESNIIMILSGACICFAGILYFIPTKKD